VPCCSLALILYPSADSTAFDPKSYYEQLITTSSLPSLLKRENELLTGNVTFHQRKAELELCPEIRELDSERQSLVYNHHHELIAASETIAAVIARNFVSMLVELVFIR